MPRVAKIFVIVMHWRGTFENVIGKGLEVKGNGESIRYTWVEAVGEELRSYMSAMQPII